MKLLEKLIGNILFNCLYNIQDKYGLKEIKMQQKIVFKINLEKLVAR